MAEFMKKLAVLWGSPVFWAADELGEAVSLGAFLTEGNPFVHAPELARELAKRCGRQEVPVVFRDENQVYFVCAKGREGYYFTGGITVEELDHRQLRQYYKKYRIPSSMEKRPPRMDIEKILNFAGLLHELFTGERVDTKELLLKNGLMEKEPVLSRKEEAMLELKIIEDEVYHHTYQEEQYVMECVREGKVEDIRDRFRALIGTAGILSSREVNHQRNLAVVSVSICTREAIKGGVSPAKAYRLSDLFINKIDKCTGVEEIVACNVQAAYEFTKMVADSREKRLASSYTEQCKDYIYKNYHRKIHLDEVARAIGISQGHLSRVFQKDTGISIQEYIQRFRVERAANLLKYSEASLTEISDYVCFSTQSHFGSVFKRYMGITPKEYRDKHKEKEFRTERRLKE